MYQFLTKLFGAEPPELIRPEDIDPGEIARELGVDKLAIRAGQKNEPASDARGVHPNEKDFVEHHRSLGKRAKTEYMNRIGEVELRRSQAEEKLDADQLYQIYREARDDIARIETDHADELREAKDEEGRAYLDWRAFRETYGISRDARVPENPNLHRAVVLSMIVIETLANMHFFAQGNPGGELGGAREALLIATVNVGLSYFTGVSLRWFNVPGTPRFLAAIGGVLYALALPLYHLAIGHYRNALGTARETAATTAMVNFVHYPFSALYDIRTCLLIIIGLAFGIIAAVEGYRFFDDPIPGYGAVTRRLRKARDLYQTREKEFCGRIRESQELREAGVARAVELSTGAFNDFRNAVAELKRLVRDFETVISSLNDSLGTIIRRYRDLIQKIRTLPYPEYLNDNSPQLDLQEFKIGMEASELDGAQDARQKLDDLKIRGKEVGAMLKDLYSDYFKGLPAFFDNLDNHKGEGGGLSPSPHASNGSDRSYPENNGRHS